MSSKFLTQKSRQRRPDVKRRVLVVSEGVVTEPQYFRRLSSLASAAGISLTIKPAKNANNWHPDPLKVVRECKRIREADVAKSKKGSPRDVEPFEHCFAIVDYDRWDESKARFGGASSSKLQQAITLAKEEGINLLVSRLKFEVWLLWHLPVTPRMTSKELDKQCQTNRIMRGKSLDPHFSIDEDTCRRAYDEARRVCVVNENTVPSSCPATAMPRFFELLGLL